MLIPELSLWSCVYCGAENDHTNQSRCWKCNKKKPKLSTVKRILAKRKKEEAAAIQAQKQEYIEKLDNPPSDTPTDLEFDLSKLQV